MGRSSDEAAILLAMVAASDGQWSKVAELVLEAGAPRAVLERRSIPLPAELQRFAADLAGRVDDAAVHEAAATIADTERQGIKLVTVLDEDYPLNLHQIFNRPPFLWVRGTVRPEDRKAIAVVGTRQATDRGLARAAEAARGLVEAGFTVVSGLARGVDTAAHTAALGRGGRTIAVIGTGILSPTYPAANRGLDREITKSGAVISQFWPTAPPRRSTFPMRNVIMSGMAIGTLVIEASQTSGAKMQARFALEHGKRLFLLDSLVDSQDWARQYAERPGVLTVTSVSEVIEAALPLTDPAYQASLTF